MSKSVNETEITIHTPFIQLGQLIKMMGLVDTGGEVKHFLQKNTIQVNEQVETRRGRKLYPGDRVAVLNQNIVLRLP
jgi:ribosome-associated protein